VNTSFSWPLVSDCCLFILPAEVDEITILLSHHLAGRP
jgi:hypothetical protein